VLGEAKANANRVTNFDAANAGRTAAAAAHQQRALEALDPEGLPPRYGRCSSSGWNIRRLARGARQARRALQERRQPPPQEAGRSWRGRGEC
jgi:hypothetical protein